MGKTEKTVHYRTSYGPACGTLSKRFSSDLYKVTCKKCLKSKKYIYKKEKDNLEDPLKN